jgi:TolC family type I secretion outer membrane protein
MIRRDSNFRYNNDVSLCRFTMRWIRQPKVCKAVVLAAHLLLAKSALANDPFATVDLTAHSAGGSLTRPLSQSEMKPCQFTQQDAPLSLPEAVDRALCNNPQTREAWANARYQAAQVGMAQSTYLPSASLALSTSRNANNGVNLTTTNGNDVRYTQSSATLSLSYLLYDFGGREATLENARQILEATNATQDATLQSVFLSTVQAYYQWHAAQATLVASHASELASLESLKAAIARYNAGTATPADKLQAQTAASQATLVRIRAEGDSISVRGVLANTLGLPADQRIDVAPPKENVVDAHFVEQFANRVGELIESAKRSRPDLAAAEAQVKAARSSIDIARASGMPSISLYASGTDTHYSTYDPVRNNIFGITLSVPLFSGFNTTYRVRSAEAQLDVVTAQRDKLSLQVSLDVWRAYQALQTEIQAVRAAVDLLESATQSEKVAQGRYRAGVGGILDLLNAQSALASARQQNIQELYNWRLARVALAQSMGKLDFAMLENREVMP